MYYEVVNIVILGVLLFAIIVSAIFAKDDGDILAATLTMIMMFCFYGMVATVKYEYQQVDQLRLGRIQQHLVYITNKGTVITSTKAADYNSPNEKLYVQRSYSLFGLEQNQIMNEESRDIPTKK